MKTAIERWPELRTKAWEETYATLHMWTQIVGKIRLAQTPLINHWWNVTFYVTARGLTTSPMPYKNLNFQIDFDFIDHRLLIICDDGRSESIPLEARSVADFYRIVMSTLSRLGIEIKIWSMPVEIENPIRFELDQKHASYDPEYANRLWKILTQCARVMTQFRASFIGKCSPVHFFWGGFDMAVTRFSGRTAPPREDAMNREAYSHEVISHGFWPGMHASGAIAPSVPSPVFYAYAAPEPQGFSEAPIRPKQASYNPVFKEFFLPYDDVRQSKDPDAMLMEFMQSTYEAGATLAKWNRSELER